MTSVLGTMDGTAVSALALAIARLTEAIEALPPFSEKRKVLAEQRSNLVDIRRKLEAIG